jgi:putative membrane protein
VSPRLIVTAATGWLIIFVYASAVRALLRPLVDLPDIPGAVIGQTLVLTLFSLTHALYALGWRHTLVFFALSAVISWTFEQIGVATGLIYGPYHYTDALGVKLGHVPVLIPLAWFMMIYPSYVMANLIASDRPTGSPGRLWGIVWVSFLSAMVMTAWDLVVDPVLSGSALPAWVWKEGGPYFGIPIQNYVGWMLTTFTVYLSYRVFEHQTDLQPVGPVTVAIAAMPLVAYGSIMISNSLAEGPEALSVIGPFVMGLPLIAAATRLARRIVTSPQSRARTQPPLL